MKFHHIGIFVKDLQFGESEISKFVDIYIHKNIRNADQKYLLAMMDEFINMILKSENVSSIDQVDNSAIEHHFSNHIDNGSMIALDGKNYSQICSLFRENLYIFIF